MNAAPQKSPPRASRLRRFALLGVAALIVACALLGAGAYWLLNTEAGRDALLKQVLAHLPQGTTLKWQRIDGALAGPLQIDGLAFDQGGIHFHAQQLRIDLALLPLLHKHVRLDQLQVRGAVLEMPASADSGEPFKLPQWPDVLPDITLPVSIQADAIEIDGFKFVQAGSEVIDVQRARGGLDIGNGYARLDHLDVRSDRGTFTANGRYEPNRRYRTDLLATAVFPAQRGHAPANFGLVARGDRKHMLMALAGNAPAPLRISAEVTGQHKPDWSFSGSSADFDPAVLGLVADSLPFQFDLHADGHAGGTLLHGTLAQGERFSAKIDPSSIAIDDNQQLTVKPLVLEVFDGRVLVNGTADFRDAANPAFNFVVEAQKLRWGGDAKTHADDVVANADLGVAGKLKGWSALGTAKLVRGSEAAALDYGVHGDDAQATIDKLHAQMPTGTLDANGKLAWAPQLAWQLGAQLAGFDPGYFVPQFAGNLSGNFDTDGGLDPNGTVNANLHVPQLQGTLRGRALDGHGEFTLHGANGEGQLALRLGGSNLDAKGKVGDTLDISAQLQPLQLSDLLPDTSGELRGTLQLHGTRTAPDVDAQLHGSNLAWQGYKAQSLDVHGHLPWQGGNGELHAQASGLEAGIALQSLQLDARGAVENLHVSAGARSDMGNLDLQGSALKQGDNWQGTLDALRIAPMKGGAWTLQQRAQFAQKGEAYSLSNTCLATQSDGGGSVCVRVDWPHDGVTAHADALPLTLVQPWLPKDNNRPINLRGALKLDADFKPQGKAWLGDVHVASSEGGLKLGKNARGEIVTYDNFSLDASFDPDTIKGRLGTGFHGDGYVDATFDTGWNDWSPLKGDLYFHNSRLFWIELFSPDLVQPSGVLAGHVAVAGTRGKPLLSGEATMADFSGELPALGIALTDGNGELSAQSDGSAKISANFHSKSTTGDADAEKNASGKGTLGVTGSLSWLDTNAPLRFDIRGDDFLVADTTQLRAVAAPDMHVEVANNTIAVSGKVAIPNASINLEKLDTGVSASEDVVVLDPADPQRTPSSRLDLALDIALAGDDKVKLKGYGLDGALSGDLRVRSRPGQSMLANGQLDVDGRYTAYGQKLTISDGSLSWSNAPVSDPVIKLRAQREVVSANVTAGIDVSGRASRPVAKVWSDPQLPESEALAYLVLGRSLGTASSQESQQISAANSALSAGAGLIASQLGAKIGLDDAGVLESRTLGGNVFGVGKYLSPKLYVSYGVSMVGAGSAVTLKYLLRKGFDMEVESSNVETRGSLNWRKEK